MAEIAFDAVMDTKVWDAFVREFPRIANQEQNRSFKRFSRAFGKKFTSSRLVKGVFDVKKRFRGARGQFVAAGQGGDPVRLRRIGRGRVGLPVKMRRAGFIAELRRAKTLQGKLLRIRTSNPLLVIREFGGTIRPRRGEFLFIRERRRGGKRVITAKVPAVHVRPVLRFGSTFKGFEPEGVGILRKGMSEAMRRGQLKIEGKPAG